MDVSDFHLLWSLTLNDIRVEDPKIFEETANMCPQKGFTVISRLKMVPLFFCFSFRNFEARNFSSGVKFLKLVRTQNIILWAIILPKISITFCFLL